MPGAARIVPEWKNLKSQICQKLQMPKELPEAGPGTPVLLSDRPSLVYRASRHPHLMPRICFYPTATANVFVCFSWGGPGVKQDQARVWLQHVADESVVVEKEVPMAQRVKVLQLSHVPSLRLLATYCDDLHLRLFGDHSQGLQLLTAVRCPHSVTSMCYNPETGELVTGAIGAISFWAFSPGPAPGLGISWAVSLAGGEFVHCLSVERDVRALVALCENTIRLYDCQRRAETQAFQLSPGISLTCCSTHGPQGHLYVGDLAGHVKLWSLETGRQEQQFKAHLSAVTSVVCRPAMHTLLTASLDGLLKEWGLGTCELLRRLDVGEPVFQLCFVTERMFYCRSQHSFSLRTLRNFYQLFSTPGSSLRRLARVPCGPGRARILATTEDGVTRFLSSVTGELLLLTWPFHRLEKALDYAYDPEREELVVTVGTADVYVLDTTICPSPAKYVVCTTENRDDKVLCLAYCRLGLGTQPSGFVFSGHRSGHVRLVSQHAHSLAEQQIHKGGVGTLCSLSACGDLSYRSPESNLLCSYGADERIVLTDVGLTGSELELRPLVVIPSTGCRIQSLLLVPGYLCALTEQNRVRLWRQATLVPRKINPYWLETCPLHSCSITSLDYCHPLQLLLLGGADGSVRVWSLTGVLLVDFDTSLQFSQVCFASLRGDLLLGCGTNIYFISCLEYLPRRHLKALAAWQVEDDVVEHPLPFLPNFLLSFDTVFVPRYLWAGEKSNCYQGMEALTSHREVMLVKRVARVVASAKTETGPSPGPEAPAGAPELATAFQPARILTKRPLCSPVALPGGEGPQAPGELMPLLQKHLLPGGPWLIGPDGYIPNSIIRAQLWPLGTPLHLQCSLKVTPRRRLPPRKPAPVQEPAASRWWEEPAEKGKVKRKPQDQPTSFVDPELPRDVLAEIVAKNWLRHRPSEVTLESVLRAVLSQLEDGPLSAYSLCTTALVQICQAYVLPPQLQAEAAARLYQGTASKNSWTRQAAWETLGEMALLSHRDVVPLARALLDPDWQVRDQARSLITSVAGITDKFALQKAIKRQVTPTKEQPSVTISGTFVPYGLGPGGPEAEKPGWAPALLGVTDLEILLAQVETRLTDNLYLAEEHPEPRARGSGTRIKWPKVSEVLSAEAAAAEPTQGQAKRQQLFGQTQLPRSSAKDAPGMKKQRRLRDKLPQIQPGAQQLTAPIMVPSSERLGPGSEVERRLGPGSEAERRLGPGSEAQRRQGPGSEAERRQGPGSEAERRLGPGSEAQRRQGPGSEPERRLGPGSEAQRRQGPGSEAERRQGPGSEAERRQGPGSKAERRQGPGSEAERRQGPAGPPGSLSSEVPKVTLPKVGQPPLGPRQDSRTKRYQETLKRQMLKTGEPLSWQPSQPSAQAIRPESSDPFVIDPSHRYGADSARWRDDLCKLFNLRVAPSADDRSALEELVASTRLALGQRSSSWSLGKSSSTVGRGLAERDAAAEELVAKLGTRLAQEAWAKRAEGGLAEGVPDEGGLAKGGLAEGVPAEGGLAKGGLAEEVPDEGSLAEGSLAEGVPDEGGLAEGDLAEEVPDEGGLAEGDLAEEVPDEGSLAEGSLAEGDLAEGVPDEGGLAEGDLAEEVPDEGGLAKGSLAEGSLAEGVSDEGGLAEGVPDEGGLAKGSLAEGSLAEGVPDEGGLAEGSLAEGVPDEGGLAKGSLAEGSLAEGVPDEGGLAEGSLAEGVPDEGGLAEGSLAEGVPDEGGLAEGSLAEGVPDEGGLAEGSLAEGVPDEGGLAEGDLAEGVPDEGGLAEGAEQVLGGRASTAPAARPEELARGSPGVVAGGVEGQVWQTVQPLLEILADPARLASADTAELLGRLQALGQCPSTEHRVALESTLAMAAQVLGEEDAGLGRAVSLCALLASPGQQLPGATVSTELLQGQPGLATELLESAQARLQASAERMGQEWAWWEQVARPGQSSLELAVPREDEAARWKTQPLALWLGRTWAQPQRLQQREPGAGGRREQAGAVPVGSQREVDLYLPDRLPTAGAGWTEVGVRRLPGKEKFLALYQVLVTLQQRHGPFSPVWWEQFYRLTELYGLRRPLSRALIQQLGVANRRGSKSFPGVAQARREVQEQSEATLGQRILYQILHRAPPKPPSFCSVIPLSYQNNVHVLQPRGEARYGAMGLAWRTAQQDGRGQQPKLHLGVG